MKILVFLFFTVNLYANPYQHDTSKVALSGYDVISYFELKTAESPIKGSPDKSYPWRGVIWHFSSEQNLQKFRGNPIKYVPQYLGYCAYAISRNYIYKGDPLAWTLYEGKLYLNANKSIRSSWLENKKQNISEANKYWPKLKNKDLE